MLKATILALVVAHAAAYNAAPLVGRGAVRAAASRRPALAVMHHGVGDHPEPAAPLAAEPAPQQKFRVLPMALGAVAGGLLLGLLEAFGVGYISSTYKDAFAFIVILLVLFAMPQGLFGRRTVERV